MQHKSSTLVVIGSANMDLISHVKQFPAPGETRSGSALVQRPGGKGANQAIAAARNGAKVSFIGNIGRDVFGDVLVRNLKQAGVNLKYLARSAQTPAGTALILLDEARENQIVVTRSSNDLVSPEQVMKAKPLIEKAGAVLLQMEIPYSTVEAAIDLAFAAGVPVILNPAPVIKPLPKKLLRKIFCLTPNEHELAVLTGKNTETPDAITSSARILYSQGVENVAVTCGARGVFWGSKAGEKWIPAPVVKLNDSVGAGDFFNGALAAGLVSGKKFIDCLNKGVLFASKQIAIKR